MKSLIVVAGLILAPALVRGEDQPASFNPQALKAILDRWEAEKTPTTAGADKVVAELQELGRPAIKSMIEALEKAQKPRSAGVLITTLVRLKASEATLTLAKLATAGPTPNLRRSAMGALVGIGTHEAMPILIQALDRELPSELAAKEKYLERDEWYKLRDKLIDTIKAMCASPVHCNAAVQAIFTLSPKATPAARARYARSLSGVRLAAAEDTLVSMAYDSAAEVQTAAVHALGMGKSPTIGKRILPLAGNNNAKVKVAVCFALGNSKYLPAMPTLIRLLASKEKDVPETALWALRNISGLQFEDPQRWQAWYDEETANSQKRLAELLQQIKTGPAELVPVAVEQIGALVLVRDKVVDELRFLLDHKDPRARAALCNVLAQSGDPRAEPLLLQKLSDRAEVVNHAAWRGLRFVTNKNLPLDVNTWAEHLAKKG